jgi:hypothetical protein
MQIQFLETKPQMDTDEHGQKKPSKKPQMGTDGHGQKTE